MSCEFHIFVLSNKQRESKFQDHLALSTKKLRSFASFHRYHYVHVQNVGVTYIRRIVANFILRLTSSLRGLTTEIIKQSQLDNTSVIISTKAELTV